MAYQNHMRAVFSITKTTNGNKTFDIFLSVSEDLFSKKIIWGRLQLFGLPTEIELYFFSINDFSEPFKKYRHFLKVGPLAVNIEDPESENFSIATIFP